MRILLRCFFLLLFGSLTGCDSLSGGEEIPEVPDVEVNWELERADRVMVNAEEVETIIRYLEAHPYFAKMGLGIGMISDEAKKDPRLISLLRLARDPRIDTLHQECEAVYGEELSDLRTEFDHAFKRLKAVYPDFSPPDVYTVVTGLGYDLMLRDSMLLIGLDYYMGNEHFPTPPPDPYGVPLPQYIWQRYQPETIVPHAVLFLVNRYARKDQSDRRLINEMITWGKVLYLAERVMPAKPEHLLIGYTAEQYANTEASAEVIYRFFVENELFFDGSREAKTKYIQERPFTQEFDKRAPGRLGVWLGWKIVRAYMEKHPEVSVQQLMAETDAQRIFEEARYRPDRE